MATVNLDDIKAIIKILYSKKGNPAADLQFLVQFKKKTYMTPEAGKYLDEMIEWYRAEVVNYSKKLVAIAQRIPVLQQELSQIIQMCEWLPLERFIVHMTETLSWLGVKYPAQPLDEMSYKQRLTLAMELYSQLIDELNRRKEELSQKSRPSGFNS